MTPQRLTATARLDQQGRRRAAAGAAHQSHCMRAFCSRVHLMMIRICGMPNCANCSLKRCVSQLLKHVWPLQLSKQLVAQVRGVQQPSASHNDARRR